MATGFDAKYDVPLIILAFCIIAINVLVISLFAIKRSLRTKTNCLLCSLATSDFLMGLLGIPLFVTCNALPYTTTLCTCAVIIYRFISVSTALHILAVTVERYIFVVYPLRYQVLVTNGRVLGVVGCVWGTASTIALVQIIWVRFHHQTEISDSTLMAEYVYNIVGIVLLFLLPVVAMLYTDVKMLIIIRRQQLRIRKQVLTRSGNFTHDKPLSRQLRSVVTFTLMLVVYVVCWTTWYLALFYEYFDLTTILSDFLWSVFDFLQFSTALINPLLYTIIKSDFRNALCKRRSINPSSSYSLIRIRRTTQSNTQLTAGSSN